MRVFPAPASPFFFPDSRRVHENIIVIVVTDGGVYGVSCRSGNFRKRSAEEEGALGGRTSTRSRSNFFPTFGFPTTAMRGSAGSGGFSGPSVRQIRCRFRRFTKMQLLQLRGDRALQHPEARSVRALTGIKGSPIPSS